MKTFELKSKKNGGSAREQRKTGYDRHGHPRLADRIRMHAPLDRLTQGIGKILGARTQTVCTRFGGAALDVDHDENLDAMEIMYDEWMAHQAGWQTSGAD